METCALQDKSNPDWPDYSHHLFPCSSWLLSSISVSLCVSKLDCYSLLPLSLVSLSRNRTKGGPEILESGIWVGDLIENLSPLSWWSSVCALHGGVACAALRVCSLMVCVWVYGGPRGAVLAACVTARKLALQKQQAVSSFKASLCITLSCGSRLQANEHAKNTKKSLLCGVMVVFFF